MIGDLRDVPTATTIRGDVVVVGAGPAGLTLAMELADAGRDVLLLESGGLPPDGLRQDLAGGHNDDPWYYRLERTRARGFAGTANLWRDVAGMRTRPLDALDLEPRPEVDRPGWPIRREDLEDDYRRAHELCELGTWSYDAEAWDPDGSRRLDLEGVTTSVFQRARRDTWPRRVTWFRASDRVRVLLNATVLEVVTTDDGTAVSHVVATDGTRRFDVGGTTFVLASGGIGNARLLLLSRRHHATGLGNGNDHVGRWFTEHPHLRSGLVVDADPLVGRAVREYGLRPRGGLDRQPMLRLTDEVLRERGVLGSAWQLLPSTPALSAPAGRALVQLREAATRRRLLPGTMHRTGRVLAAPGEALRGLRDAARRDLAAPSDLVELSAMGEQLPDRDNRVTLGTDRDANGQPVAALHWRLGRRDREALRAFQDHLDAVLQSRGLGRVVEKLGDEVGTEPVLSGGFHHLGTTRMSASATSGVVDAEQRVHDVANLYVTGSSVFPSGGFANPTLTVVALAVRLARHLARRAD